LFIIKSVSRYREQKNMLYITYNCYTIMNWSKNAGKKITSDFSIGFKSVLQIFYIYNSFYIVSESESRFAITNRIIAGHIEMSMRNFEFLLKFIYTPLKNWQQIDTLFAIIYNFWNRLHTFYNFINYHLFYLLNNISKILIINSA
jgi:hypothetical protein